ncbi:MAG: tetratricopeptide repeat protein [Alphaproteobacteria bacterium]|nr:tetratricopeptide repeat protein [Alphaproteobacteria bacterium]MDE2043218.1 tetratricopeptide repeat protein [Alphaproteobacteria bacterium]MDE2340584.1 tetratricopeptide repeat protein [Alphaproteobacteria bacterium]
MAQPPDTNTAFLREVDEELSYDRVIGFLRGNARALIVGLVVVFGAFGGWLLWQNHTATVAGEQGEKFAAAFDAIKARDAKGANEKLADLAANGNPGYRAAAKILSADIALEQGDTKTGIAKLKALADESGVDNNWRNVALIKATGAEYDALPPSTIIERMKPLAIPGKPWFGTAGEMMAMAYFKENKPGLAGRLFASIAADKSVPDSIAARARQMATSLGIDTTQNTIKENGQ